MAEANPEELSNLPEMFEKAATHLQSLVSSVDQQTLLKLYGLYKQATIGICDTPQPGWFQMQAKKKWEAWKELGDMQRQTAMKNYVSLIQSIDTKWDCSSSSDQKSAGWVAVSSMPNTDVILEEADKNIFDWVKEGNIIKVKEWAKGCPDKKSISTVDSEGMGLIHWAADRGNLPMLRTLITDLNADLALVDSEGQTALHYAAACGHTDVVKFLLESGADPNASDGGGLLPFDVASESNIEELLNIKT